MAKTVGQYIEENKTVIDTLAKASQVPASVVRSHQIYSHYCGLSGGKMDRYERTAQDTGANVETVRKIVKNMQKPI